MKVIYSCLLIIFGVSASSVVFAKSDNDAVKAKYLYDHMAFHEAIPYFEKALENAADRNMYAQLGDCYRTTGNYEKAANNYKKAMGTNEDNDIVILHYAESLMTLAQYEEAEKLLETYLKKHGSDNRVANLIKGCVVSMETHNKTQTQTVALLDLNTNSSEFAPTVWKDKLVFTSDAGVEVNKKKDKWSGEAYYNIYSVSCDKEGHCGTKEDKVSNDKGVNTKYHNGPCTFSADGNTMYFTRTGYANDFLSKLSIRGKKVATLEIMIASGYDETKKQFEDITPFQYNNKNYSVADPAISPDGNMLVFSSDMPGGAGGFDLYMCKRIGEGQWSKPESLGININTEGEELFPYFADNKTLYFSSDGHIGYGGLDIYRSIWDEKRHTFLAPENAGSPVNSSYDDISLAIDKDGKSAYFSSNRPASKKGDNIYFYTKEDPAIPVVKKDSVPAPALADNQAKVNSEANKQTREDNKQEEDNKPIAGNKSEDVNRLKTDNQAKVNSEANKQTREDNKQEEDDKPIAGNKSEDVNKLKTEVKAIATNPKQPDVNTIKQSTITEAINKNKPEKTKDNLVYKAGESFQIPNFHYAFKQADVVKNAEKELDTLYKILIMHPEMRIQVNAFTDCRGAAAFNMKLSYIRAHAVVKYLEHRGISSGRLTYKGYGVTKPVVKCPVCKDCTEEQHQLNRGIEFKVLSP